MQSLDKKGQETGRWFRREQTAGETLTLLEKGVLVKEKSERILWEVPGPKCLYFWPLIMASVCLWVVLRPTLAPGTKDRAGRTSVPREEK